MYTVKSVFEKEAKEMRAIYCQTLQELARENDKIAVLDADLVGSSGMKAFFTEFPDRAINCGIQENNMIGVAAGLSAAGMVPFAHSFGPFASRRCVDQIFISCAYAKLNVRIIGSDPGVTAAYNGGTHMPFEDMGILRVMPGVTVMEPSDGVMLADLIQQMADTYGVQYIRFTRKNAVRIYEEGSHFEIGKAVTVRDGKDATIITCGILVAEALKAAETLAAEGIDVRVVDMFTLKPIDADCILRCAKETGAIVTAENHQLMGGLFSAVSEVLAENGVGVAMEKIGIHDEFGEVGDQDYLMERFQLSAPHIAAAVRKAVSRK